MDRYRYNSMPDPLEHCAAVLPAHTVFPQQTSWSIRPRNPHNGPATDRPVSVGWPRGARYLSDATDSPSPHPSPRITQQTGKRQSRRRSEGVPTAKVGALPHENVPSPTHLHRTNRRFVHAPLNAEQLRKLQHRLDYRRLNDASRIRRRRRRRRRWLLLRTAHFIPFVGGLTGGRVDPLSSFTARAGGGGGGGGGASRPALICSLWREEDWSAG